MEEKFKITKESIEILNQIISKMEGKTFHNHYHILWDIVNSLNKKNIKYLEIGAYAGGSASLVAQNKNVSEVYSIDIGSPIDKEIPITNVNKFKNSDCSYEYIHGSSMNNEIIGYVNNKINNIDVLFIDGDHRYDAVIGDFNNYKNLVSQGGYIIFDDYLDPVHSPGVFIAVNDIIKNLDVNEYEIIGTISYEFLKDTNTPNLSSSNEFILKKIK